MTIHDITRRISPDLKVWPGDTQFSAEHLLDIAKGHSVNLLTLHLSTHTGTHADAPYHYDSAGSHPDTLPLEKYIGMAHVVTIARQHGGITPADLGGFSPDQVERLLIHTWVSELPDDQWPDDFPYPTVE